MENNEKIALPFLTRKMLNFEYATRFQLLLSTRAILASTIDIVGATKEGIFKFSKTVGTTSTTEETYFNIPDLPIWVSVIDRSYAAFSGEVYAGVALAINGTKIQELCAGYVYQTQGITWPSINKESPQEQKGKLDVYSGTNPAAGVETSVTVPGGECWKIKALSVDFTTSATAANRRVHLKFQIEGADIYEFISSIDHAASLTKHYVFQPVPTAGTYSDDNDIIVPIAEDIFLLPGDSITTSTTNKQAGDDFAAIECFVERFIYLVEP
jgi:hypothetical protein